MHEGQDSHTYVDDGNDEPASSHCELVRRVLENAQAVGMSPVSSERRFPNLIHRRAAAAACSLDTDRSHHERDGKENRELCGNGTKPCERSHFGRTGFTVRRGSTHLEAVGADVICGERSKDADVEEALEENTCEIVSRSERQGVSVSPSSLS